MSDFEQQPNKKLFLRADSLLPPCLQAVIRSKQYFHSIGIIFAVYSGAIICNQPDEFSKLKRRKKHVKTKRIWAGAAIFTGRSL